MKLRISLNEIASLVANHIANSRVPNYNGPRCCVLETMATIMTNRQPAGIRTKRCSSVHLRKQMQCTPLPKLCRLALQGIVSITYACNFVENK